MQHRSVDTSELPRQQLTPAADIDCYSASVSITTLRSTQLSGATPTLKRRFARLAAYLDMNLVLPNPAGNK